MVKGVEAASSNGPMAYVIEAEALNVLLVDSRL
jgi:hypothetical protein